MKKLRFFHLILLVAIICQCTASSQKKNQAKSSSQSKANINLDREWNNEYIDKHALSIPRAVETDLDSLAYQLTYPFVTERAKARAIFRWISQNIRYDWYALQSGAYLKNPMDASHVLETKLTVCEGYANLFNELASRSGLESVKVIGHGKGFGYDPNKPLGSSNHAWNAVKIGGQWKLIDVTWASGGDTILQDQKQFNDFYFLTPPEYFINDHFPANSKWQLLDKSISKSEFHRTVRKSSEYFKFGINNINYNQYTIRGEAIISIFFDTIENLEILAKLNESDKYYFVSKIKNSYGIYVTSPGKGTYSLQLYAKYANEKGTLPFLLEYKVIFSGGNPFNQFVTVYSGNHTIHDPILKFLNANQIYDFQFTVPGVNRIAFVDGNGKWTYYLNRGNNDFYIRNYFSKGKLTINIDVGKDLWPTIAEYYMK
ncbi:hypothetical protein LFX15_15455 [Leptospira levettii]|uniref:transglutaminase domain-containing protein n=1 Tax=Leptospira levettii TaxID=2023178 RepID=UPI001EEC93AB|nr:transglutaminase domain-containing protein [Leptospira levettii]MCG6149693.1 hypothetical protein [Leptospira levettii]